MRKSIVTRVAVLMFCIATFAIPLSAAPRERDVKERTPIQKIIRKVFQLITPTETYISVPKP